MFEIFAPPQACGNKQSYSIAANSCPISVPPQSGCQSTLCLLDNPVPLASNDSTIAKAKKYPYHKYSAS